jgi:NADPH-dependent 2,4-dienoyl-CoA reductase/sulfur reductase-like enzyme
VERRDVVIVGGGPAGLAAARRLAEHGMRSVTVLEREAEAGGVPRHCGHLGFGWQSHRRVWSGPRFAEELRRGAQGLDIRTGITVLGIGEGGVLGIRDRHGHHEIHGKRILIATGTRETPRAARFIGGSRPSGVMTTGALQQHVYLQAHRPFSNPVIIGTELVSFSAILTCRHLGIKPAAMIEEGQRIGAPGPGRLVARTVFGVPVLLSTRVTAIIGTQAVEAVEIETGGRRRRIACDGVIVSGRFVPERAVFAEGPHLFTAGNVKAPLKTSGQCWRDGRIAADKIFESLS